MSIVEKLDDILAEYGSLDAYHKALDEAHAEYLVLKEKNKEKLEIEQAVLIQVGEALMVHTFEIIYKGFSKNVISVDDVRNIFKVHLIHLQEHPF